MPKLDSETSQQNVRPQLTAHIARKKDISHVTSSNGGGSRNGGGGVGFEVAVGFRCIGTDTMYAGDDRLVVKEECALGYARGVCR